MEISVIIPTRDRPDSLRRTLASLREQRHPSFEVVVVDNSSTASARQAVFASRDGWDVPVRHVHHAAGGSAEARNRGVREAKGSVLVFTDDDITVSPRWLAAYARRFAEHADMEAASGRVEAAWEIPPPAWLVRYLDTKTEFGVFALLDRGEHFLLSRDMDFWSCNMAIRRRVFAWTGFHPELYGPRTLGDGETGLGRDIRQRGGLIGYVPDAVAHHHIGTQRMTVRYIKRWAWHLSGCVMFQHWWRRKADPSALAADVWRIVRRFAPYWLRAPLVRHRRDPVAIDIQFNASLGWAQVMYLWWILTDPLLKELLARESFVP